MNRGKRFVMWQSVYTPVCALVQLPPSVKIHCRAVPLAFGVPVSVTVQLPKAELAEPSNVITKEEAVDWATLNVAPVPFAVPMDEGSVGMPLLPEVVHWVKSLVSW